MRAAIEAKENQRNLIPYKFLFLAATEKRMSQMQVVHVKLGKYYESSSGCNNIVAYMC